MAANADIWTEQDDWRKPLAWSLALHGALLASILIYGIVGFGRGEDWGGSGGGGGGAMSATLVSSIPLPANPEGTNLVANESKGLTQSLPKQEEKPEPQAIPIPDRNAKDKSRQISRSTTPKKSEPVQTASNVIPYGQGGPVSGPYGVFNSGGAKGGFGFSGGGGDFGSRYAWYVDAVRRKVSQNWLQYEIDPNIHDARRVYITFRITRSGKATDIQVEQSSGIPSLDISATRALQRIDAFPPLPGDYSGSSVNVEFWFDYRR